MPDLGEITWILSMHVTCDQQAKKYVEYILERFDKSSVHPISTPALANGQLKKLKAPVMHWGPLSTCLGHPRSSRTPSRPPHSRTPSRPPHSTTFSRCFPTPPARFSGTLCTLCQHPPHWPFDSGSTSPVPFYSS